MRRHLAAAHPLAAVPVVAVLLCPLAARAAFVQDTVVVVTVAPALPPAVVIDPRDATPHVAVRTTLGYLHLWRPSGIWQQETIAPAGVTPGIIGVEWAIGATGRPALLHRGAAGELIVSRPSASVWQPDTLAPPPGTLAGYSLALDPVTDQPVVAWAASDGVTNRLRIARRGASAWQTWQVDSSSIYIGHPSLALDATGRPRIAVVRWDGSQGPGVYCVEANVPAGPWTWSLASADVEPGGMFAPHASIALDPITAEPRIAWVSTAILGYASRTAGIWTSQTMGSGTWRAPPTLALDDAGRPRILVTDENPILAAGPAAVQACGGVVTHLLHLFDRATATGSGPFQESIIANHVEAYAHALAIGGPLTHLVWRDTEFNTCVPADMIHAVEGTVGVPFAVAAGRGALELSPMPMRHGGATSVTLRLDAPGRVALDVTDVAGRRMARHTLDASGGVTVLRWELGGLRAGVYQVTARRDGIRFGSATLVVR